LLFLAVGEMATAALGAPANSLVLQQLLNGQVRCVSPDSTCTVNLYGPNGVLPPPLIHPGSQNTTTVQLRNAGTLAADSLVVSPSLCQNRTLAGGSGGDLCGTLTVQILCTNAGGATLLSFGPQTLTRFGQAGTHRLTNALAPGTSATCHFTVTYPAASPVIIGMEAEQPVSWTLTAAQAAPPTTSPSAPAPTPAPGAAAPGPLPRTGAETIALALAGLVLLAVGWALFWVARRREARLAG
jgi:LPXTG-motif cell wall-anchored protein